VVTDFNSCATLLGPPVCISHSTTKNIQTQVCEELNNNMHKMLCNEIHQVVAGQDVYSFTVQCNLSGSVIRNLLQLACTKERVYFRVKF